MPIIAGCAPGGTGDPGTPGGIASADPPSGAPAKDAVPVVVRTADIPTLPVAPPPIWLNSLFHNERLSYISGQTSDDVVACVTRLTWLQSIVLSGRRFVVEQGSSKEDLLQYDAVSLAISSLIYYIRMGLDVYGRSQNYITLVAYDYISDLLDKQIADVEAIESYLAALQDRQRSQADRLQVLKVALNTFNDSLGRTNAAIDALSKRVGDLQDEISTSLVTLGGLWAELFTADTAFRNAVGRTAGGGCDFEGVLKCAALVTTIVATGGAGAAVFAAGGQAVSGLQAINATAVSQPTFSFSNMQTDFKQIVTLAKPVGSSIDDLKKAYQDVKPALDALGTTTPAAPGVPGLPSDYAKLVTSKADFDKQIEPYLGLSEARAYKALVDQFVAVSETRNNKISEHDARVSDILNAYAESASRKAGVQQLAFVDQSNFDASLDQNVLYLNTQLGSIRISIIKEIIDMAKSIEYATLVKSNIVLDREDAPYLKATVNQIKSDYYNTMVKFGQPPQPAGHILVPLDGVLSKRTLSDFLAGKPVVVSIPTDAKSDPFDAWFATQTVAITLTNRNGSPIRFPVKFFFENQGRSVVFDDQRTPHVFSHTSSIRGFFSQDAGGMLISDGAVLDDSNRWLGVSPYGPWIIKLSTVTPESRQIFSQSAMAFQIRARIAKFHN